MKEYIERSWVEINLSQIRRNYTAYKKIFNKQKIIAVVKADAYGHGDIEVARVLMQEGVSDFAVSNVEEACKLRNAGIKGEILVLGYTPISQLQRILDHDITQTLISETYAEKVASANIKIKCQFAIDTGMNRIGLDADEPEECTKIIRKYYKKLKVMGIFTHLCVADDEGKKGIDFTERQIHKFEKIANEVMDLQLTYIHCMNSAGGMWHKSKFDEYVRLGIVLYGLKPDYSSYLPDEICPAMEWKSVVAMVKTVHAGETIGYGRSFLAKKEIKVATIPTGYADGYNRLLSNKGFVLIHGQKAFILGKICMDQFMIDVTEIENIDVGTEVVLIGKSGYQTLTADDMAHMIGTIGYEVVSSISKRVSRVFID